jgi:hypothetical protein
MWLLPVEASDHETGTKNLTWKIWILSTRLDHLNRFPEDQNLLHAPSQRAIRSSTFDVDVFIVGGGNAAAALAARLKALDVSSVMADRNANVGDNWALRYDSLEFHVPTLYCGLPFSDYPAELQDKTLRRDDLAAHLMKYVQTFRLDIINSVEITRTTREANGQWRVEFRTPRRRVYSSSKTSGPSHRNRLPNPLHSIYLPGENL